jgi:hypothetical protein
MIKDIIVNVTKNDGGVYAAGRACLATLHFGREWRTQSEHFDGNC